jgi:hypothetical protein
MIRRLMNFATVALAGIAFVGPTPAAADDVKLPPTIAVTAYDTGTAGFNIAVGVGKMMKDKYGTDVRVLPAGNDVARLAPLGQARRCRRWDRVRISRRKACQFGAGMGSAGAANVAVIDRL